MVSRVSRLRAAVKKVAKKVVAKVKERITPRKPTPSRLPAVVRKVVAPPRVIPKTKVRVAVKRVVKKVSRGITRVQARQIESKRVARRQVVTGVKRIPEAVGGTARAITLAPLFGAGAAQTTISAARQKRAAIRIGERLERVSVPVPFGSKRIGLNIPGAIVQSFREEKAFALGTRQAKRFKAEASIQREFIKTKEPELEEISLRRAALNQVISGQTAGGFTDAQIKDIEKQRGDITRSRQEILGQLKERGITTRDEEGKVVFGSTAIDTDIRAGSTKFLEAFPRKGPARELVIAGRSASALAQGVLGGAALRVSGGTRLISSAFSRLAPAGQKGVVIGLGTLVVGGTGLKAVSGAARAPEGLKGAVAASTVFETGARLGGLLAGTDPTRFSPIQVSNLKFKAVVSPEGETQFVQGGKGAVSFVKSIGLKIPGTTDPSAAFPFVTRAPVGGITTTKLTAGKLIPTGGEKLIFRTGFGGIPKGGFVVPSGEFTPSGSFETKLALQGLENVPKAQQQLVAGGFKFVQQIRGTGPKLFRIDPLQQTKGFQKLSPFQQDRFLSILKEETGGRFFLRGRVFGSAVSNVQLKSGLGRQPSDVDFRRFISAEGFAKSTVAKLNKLAGPRLKISPENPGQIFIGKQKLLDISGSDIAVKGQEAVEAPFGFREQPLLKIGQIRGTRLTQEAAGKISSIAQLSPKGFVPGAPKTRVKDVGDLLRFGPELISRLPPSQRPAALKSFTTFKAGAIEKFGKQILTGPSSPPSPSLILRGPSITPSLTAAGMGELHL